MRKSKGKIVEEITPEAMAGDTPLERQINAYLCKQFIWSGGLPADECLREAREVIKMVADAVATDEGSTECCHDYTDSDGADRPTCRICKERI